MGGQLGRGDGLARTAAADEPEELRSFWIRTPAHDRLEDTLARSGQVLPPLLVDDGPEVQRVDAAAQLRVILVPDSLRQLAGHAFPLSKVGVPAIIPFALWDQGPGPVARQLVLQQRGAGSHLALGERIC